MKIDKRLFISFLFLCGSCASAQRYAYVYKNVSDSTSHCYLKVIPQTKKIKALVIRDYSSLPDTSQPWRFQLTTLCAQNGIMTLYTVSSGFFPELFYTDSTIHILDDMVNEVVEEHRIPRENIFIGGISASGTRALKYAQFCQQGKSSHALTINGVFAVDSPLDIERFYYSALQHKSNFKQGMLTEAELVLKTFPQKLGGTPNQVPEKYRAASVFSHTDSLGGNAVWLKDVNLLFIHEPDMDWWMNERGASYYDINSYDMAALYVALKTQGSVKTEMITTSGKGFDQQGNRNCHSWTIVDENYLMDWILKRIKK